MSNFKIYKGVRSVPGFYPMVYVDGQPLDLNPSKVDIHDYGADCFEWSYRGAGPSQLAAAILYDITTDIELTKRYHGAFRDEYIANFDSNGFVLLEIQVTDWLANFRKNEEEL